MNKLILTLTAIALYISQIANAQVQVERKDSVLYFKGKVKIYTKEKEGEKSTSGVSISTQKDKNYKPKKIETSWFAFGMGFNNYDDRSNYTQVNIAPNTNDKGFFSAISNPSSNDFALKTGKSININFDIFKTKISLINHYVNLVTGLTYDINNWNYKSQITWHKQPDVQNGLYFQGDYYTRDLISYKKTKLVTNYLQVPLLLRFETSPLHKKQNIFLSAGAYAGYLVRSHTKQIKSGSDDKIKQHDDFNITKLQYGLQAEIGYRNLSFYAKKSLTPLTEYGTVQYPYSFGVRFSNF